ncbi:radical SAM family heme chaperone HemW [Paenibacillus tepidiphilus]|uniref:radical SAM family heme chaperone HemW n=1 Tax=Paenibacillus tepidiphilus TaxID=2608683 RepID=UPI001238A5AE|nr:radical SAM family heme chaperone HemW [Paenibacillus tepidiphilus]
MKKINFDWDRSKQYFFLYPPMALLEPLHPDVLFRKELALYFHVPFCEKKCTYCYYVSLPKNQQKDEIVQRYFEALKSEFRMYIKLLKHMKVVIKSIYFGGGTPTLVAPKYLIELIDMVYDNFEVSEEIEITTDSCPSTLSEENIGRLKENKVNRVCMGVQTFNDDILKRINRSHTAELAVEKLGLLKKMGIQERIIDIMYGLPNQSLDQFHKDIQVIKEMEPEGVSFYKLSIRPSTEMYHSLNQRDDRYPSNEDISEFIDTLIREMRSAAYKHVASPSFSKQPYDFKHQHHCWSGGEYIGMGVSSFSYFNNFTYTNVRSISKYLKCIEEGTFPLDVGKELSSIERLHRDVSFQVKLLEIERVKLSQKHGINVSEYFQDEFGFLLANNLACEKPERNELYVTDHGVEYNDSISRIFYSSSINDQLDRINTADNLKRNLI